MAQLIALRNALVRMGCSASAALALTDAQGYSSLGHFAKLDDEGVKNLCKVARRPGGTIPNPDADPDDDEEPNFVPNPGVAISAIAEANLMKMCYLLKHLKRVSRTALPGGIDETSLESIEELKRKEEDPKGNKPDLPTVDTQNMVRTFEDVEEYLSVLFGVNGTPMAYMIRELANVPPEATDPSTNYRTPREEMIARAPHVLPNGRAHPVYLEDNERLWDILVEIFRATECYTFMRRYQRARDGRAAYTALKAHYLGPNAIDNIVARSERRLRQLQYHRESRSGTFEQYLQKHCDEFSLLENLKPHGYEGMDERTRVRLLVEGIRAPHLHHVMLQVLADQNLRKSFDNTARLYQDFISQTDGGRDMIGGRDMNLAGVTTEGDGNEDSDGSDSSGSEDSDGSDDGSDDESANAEEEYDIEPDMSVEVRYYDETEYQDLTREQKLGLKLKREALEESGERAPKKRRKIAKSEEPVKLDKATIKALASAVAEYMRSNVNDDDN